MVYPISIQETIFNLIYVFVKQKERLNTISKTENQTNEIKQAKKALNQPASKPEF